MSEFIVYFRFDTDDEVETDDGVVIQINKLMIGK